MIKVICFDLWKTLAREPYTMRDYWRPLLERYPEIIDFSQLAPLVDKYVMKKSITITNGVTDILSSLGIQDLEISLSIIERWKTSCNRSSLYDDVIPSLIALRRQGFKLGLVTNTSAYGWQYLNKKYVLEQYFDIFAKSFELGAVKPEAAIFEYIEKQSNTSPNNIFMIGDSYENDVRPALARGWRALQLVRSINKNSVAKPGTIKHLTELGNMLRQSDG